MAQFGGGEAVVQLDQVEVLRRDAGGLVGLVGGLPGKRVDVELDRAAVDVGVTGQDRGRHLDRAPPDLGRQRVQPLAAGEHGRRGAVAGRAAHQQRVGIGDHLRVHDLLEPERLLVLGQRVEGGVRVVLLSHLGELLEPDSVVLVGVLHAGLRERPGHQAGTEDALDRADRAVAAGRLEGPVAGRSRGDAEQTALAHLLQADGQPDVGLARLDGHGRHPERGRAGRAGIGHVVHGNPGLPDLLLDALPDAAGLEQAAGRQDVGVEDRQPGVGERGQGRLAAQVDEVLVVVAHELGHRRADDPERVSHARSPSAPAAAGSPAKPATAPRLRLAAVAGRSEY